MVKHTQTICRQFADELFECVWPFCDIGGQSFNIKDKLIVRVLRVANGNGWSLPN